MKLQHENITISNYYGKLNNSATLVTYVQDNFKEIDENRKRPAVIICPGGAYVMTSAREAEPVALAFLSRGYHAFVLNYSVAPTRYPNQLLELAASLDLIRKNADKWNVDQDALIVCGFSAGAHLTCSLGAFWQELWVSEALGTVSEKLRPNAMILGYPVITTGEFIHKGSFDALLGERPDKAMLRKLSLENSVGPQTPPVFLWHTLNDAGVAVENSFLLANALKQAGVSFEMHIYPSGRHGLSLATEESRSCMYEDSVNPAVASWLSLCDTWLRTQFPLK